MTEIIRSAPSFEIEAVLWVDDSQQLRILEPQAPFVDEEAGLQIQEFALRGVRTSEDEVRASLLVAGRQTPAWHIKAGGSREVELPAGTEPCAFDVWRRTAGGPNAAGYYHYERVILEPRSSDTAQRPLIINPGDIFRVEPLGTQACVLSYFRTPFRIENEERVEPPFEPFHHAWGER